MSDRFDTFMKTLMKPSKGSRFSEPGGAALKPKATPKKKLTPNPNAGTPKPNNGYGQNAPTPPYGGGQMEQFPTIGGGYGQNMPTPPYGSGQMEQFPTVGGGYGQNMPAPPYGGGQMEQFPMVGGGQQHQDPQIARLMRLIAAVTGRGGQGMPR